MRHSMREMGPGAQEAFDRKRKSLGIVLGPLLALAILACPIAGLQRDAHMLLAIMALVCTWWITEPIPIPVTSLLGPVLCVVSGVSSAPSALASFANPMIFLFMGGFMLAAAMTRHGLDRRFAYALLSTKWVGSNPRRIFLTIGVATALCSGWISNTATAAMMLPIALGLLDALREMFAANGRAIDLKTYKYATGLMLITAYSASIGGVLTPIGTPPNLIMVGFLETMANVHISFFEWMVWGFAAMAAYFAIAVFVVYRMFPADVTSIEGADAIIARRRAELGPWTQGQRNALLAFAVAVALWIAPGLLSLIFGSESSQVSICNALFPESVAALIAALMLFFLPTKDERGARVPTLPWKDAVEGVDWGTLILFGGGLSLGSMMYATGLSEWVGASIVGMLGGAPTEVAITATFCVLALLMSELTSHTAATNMVGPLAITTAIAAGMSPVPVAVGVALSASLGFMLPVSTPPNAIVYASGYIPITKMIKAGFVIDLVGIAAVTIPLVLLVVSVVVAL